MRSTDSGSEYNSSAFSQYLNPMTGDSDGQTLFGVFLHAVRMLSLCR
jgi:hypothetical protein